ncbi:Dabb family protein [Rhizobium oryzicola]|uniref:Dabb family protein n=2 Tax=Rhizobium oryzicola TaxID=1232668 RepID=A0ABT8SXJ4_9HYPH|nr:Dabb family protein [Rhizobium oryzicola]MDO1583153.1 Dabb family protein [Rhizobium oryzicola]
MIRHIVLIHFRSEVTEAQIAAMFEELEAIRSKISGVRAITAGRSESPEKIERGYRHGFVVDFDGWDALEAYQTHPDHKALGAKLVAHAQGGLDGILVFDLPVHE